VNSAQRASLARDQSAIAVSCHSARQMSSWFTIVACVFGASSLTELSSEGHGHVLNVDKQLAMNGDTSVFIVKGRYFVRKSSHKKKGVFLGQWPLQFHALVLFVGVYI
jgi:hypothetical protein